MHNNFLEKINNYLLAIPVCRELAYLLVSVKTLVSRVDNCWNLSCIWIALC